MRRASRWRLLALLALFLGLTAAGLAAAAWVAGESGRSVWALATTLDRGTLGGACALAVGLLVADIARFWLAGRLIQAPISWRAATDASIASSFFAWVTPGSALAEPATIVALTRHRAISADVAATLTLTKTMTSLVILMTTCAAVLVSGWGPALPWPLYAPLVTGTSVLGVVGACLLGASSRPGLLLGPLDALAGRLKAPSQRIQRLRAQTQATLERLGSLHRVATWPGIVGMMAGHVAYYVCFLGVPWILGAGLMEDASLQQLARLMALCVVYQTFTTMAPTPGGAGLAEASAWPFFHQALEAPEAALMVVISRALTFYAQIALGLIYLSLIGILWRGLSPPQGSSQP